SAHATAGLYSLSLHDALPILSRCHCQCGHPAFESGDTLLEHVIGGVHDAAVDVAELLQREEPGCVVGVVEAEGRRLVDGHGPGFGGRVNALLACVDLKCLVAVCHLWFSFLTQRGTWVPVRRPPRGRCT